MERKKIIRKVFTTPDWKEVARPRVSAASNHFLIDTNREMVFCRHCRDLCDAIELADFTMYWCPNKLCENVYEFRHLAEGQWVLREYGGIFNEPEISAKFDLLILNALAAGRKTQP